MSVKCGKRCAERGCQSPHLHNGRGAKFCVPCSRLVDAGATAKAFCDRCRWLWVEMLSRIGIGEERGAAVAWLIDHPAPPSVEKPKP